MGKLLRHILLQAFVILATSLLSYASDVEMFPQDIAPGDVFLLKVRSDKTDLVHAEFLGKKINFSPDGTGQLIALVPVDIDSAPGKYRISLREGEKTQSVPVHVRPFEFETIKLTLPEGKVTLSPENQKRAGREAELLNEIWPRVTARAWEGPFSRPTDTETSTAFGVKRIMNEKKTSVHRGMDFRGKTGTPVKAINSGTVVLTDDLFYGGHTLIVDHGMGLHSVYMHLSGFNAKKGDKVDKGQVVAFIGNSGRVTGPHLHMSVKLNGVSVNPESLFRLRL